MRLAVIADVHGNCLALDAVLADLDQGGGADVVVDLGDRVSGPLWPAETMARLETLSPLAVRGNHDRAVAVADPEGLSLSDRFAWQSLSEVRRSALGALPLTREVVPGVLACHAQPGRDHAYLLEDIVGGVLVRSRAAIISARLGSFEGLRVILCGHSHRADMVRLPSGSLIINPGSVGCPAYDDPDPPAHVSEAGSPHARYAVLDLLANGDALVSIRAVTYDHEAAAQQAEVNGRSDWAQALRTGWVAEALSAVRPIGRSGVQ